jgi:protein-S-isoprenylcysteine O-methyltransferase Ste14
MSLEHLEESSFARALLVLGFARPGERTSGQAVTLDIAERILIACLFGSFAHRMLMDGSGSPSATALLVVLSESLPFFFVLLRAPAKTLSLRPSDWVIGIAASLAPLLVQPDAGGHGSSLREMIGYGGMTAGLFVQVSAKVMLGRRFGLVPANRGVRMLGPYRFVRHPMYAGYTLTHLGFLLAVPNPLNASIYAAALTMQLIRIAREEAVLIQDPVYEAYAARVRYRLFPGVY